MALIKFIANAAIVAPAGIAYEITTGANTLLDNVQPEGIFGETIVTMRDASFKENFAMGRRSVHALFSAVSEELSSTEPMQQQQQQQQTIA